MEVKELSKLITKIENDPIEGRKILKDMEKKDSLILGVTGSPGVGKSTLVDRLIECYRKREKTVGVVAVDPSSPFSGGAFLGDRIRMKRHFTDDGVFIRSMASRGSLGGLNDSIFDVVNAYRAFGFDVIIVETVGAGQTEIDIAYVAHTILLVLAPGGGDEVQMMKAGITEIADIFVVNKSDIPGADALVLSIRAMLDLSEREGWIPPIVQTDALSGKGIEELCGKIEEHREYLLKSGEMKERIRRSVKKHVEHVLMNRIRSAMEDLEGDFESVMKSVLLKLCERSSPSP